MKDQSGGGVSVARKIVSPKRPQPARQVLAQQSAASRVSAQKKMLQTMVKQSTSGTGASKSMYSMTSRPQATGGDAWKYLWQALTRPIPSVDPNVNPSAPYANQFIDLANKSRVAPIAYNAVSNPAIFGDAWSRLRAPPYSPF